VSEAKYDVLGIGNAIVDVIAHADEAFLAAHKMEKGGMALIDEAQAEGIYQAMAPGIEASGGSAGNTIAGVASLGGKAAYIGKVRKDQLGDIYRHDLTALGVHFETAASEDGPSTARCLVLVTTDAQRTMNTFLGACVNLTVDDIDEALVADSAITYLEGYLFDPPQAKDAFRKAARAARAAGRKVALSLSDSFCVHRYRDEFRELVSEHIDVLFANEDEIKALYQVESLDAAVALAAKDADTVAVTCGAEGSVLVRGGEEVRVPAAPVARVVDTTGAGDLYASGVLFGLSRGLPLADCGRLGSIAAGEIISHFGARPEVALTTLTGAVTA
jgi:sugar/nucleoside kinase (ribokinase family)